MSRGNFSQQNADVVLPGVDDTANRNSFRFNTVEGNIAFHHQHPQIGFIAGLCSNGNTHFRELFELGTAIGSDWDSEKYSSDVKPGSSTTVEMGYALEDMSDITVEVEELLSFSDAVLAEQTFSLS